jgi:hypothetical protein
VPSYQPKDVYNAIEEQCFWQVEVVCGTVYSHNSITFTSFKWTHILNSQSENIIFPNIYFDMVAITPPPKKNLNL